MASTSRRNHTHTITYDVFLSFRGEDTRHNFTDHLYHALLRAGLRTFRDNDEIDRGEELKSEIETAIINSRSSIIVLSENYATSGWCLDELCLILEQRRKCDHFVLPVFYHVDPSDVRNQRGSFAIKRSKRTEDNMRMWKVALTEVGNLTGMELSGSETDFITKMVDTVQCKLDLKQLSTPAHLIGMENRVGVINSWLKNGQSNAIAICGMGGSGKTTLAQCIYNLNKQDFESSSFIEEIGKHFKHGLLGLQKQLLRDLSSGKKIRISSISEGTHKIQEVLQKKKALIVLDDIDDQDELNTLLGTKAFPTYSKIIITTRLLDIHAWFRSISWRCWVHRLRFFNDGESLQLLSWHAFGSKVPMKGFEELAIQLAQYCGGNPLALKVLGSSLFVRDKDPRTINSMKDIWRSKINSLNSLKGDIDCKIQGVLQKSFDSLPLQSHKELFLHIACFFVGEDVHFLELTLEDEWYARSGILTLLHRCLLTISAGKLVMHQLLQEMGRRIVCEESKDPSKRSRVWRDAESYHVLRKGHGSDTIEGLALDMRNIEQGARSETLALKTSSLANMDKLKLLQLKYVKLAGSFENFPELIWLCWHGCPLPTLPFGLLMSSLVAIDMSYGDMETFEAPVVLNSLKILSLKGCNKLVSIYSLYQLPKLEDLNLQNCGSLTHLCKSIGDLENLDRLHLTGCAKLWKCVNQLETTMMLPQQAFSLPQSLTRLELSNCGLEFNNGVCVAFHAQSSFHLHLAVNPFKYLPNNIDLKMLRTLNLYSCQNLMSLPCIPITLVALYIDWCTSLERVTFESSRFTLRDFAYKGCFKLSEIEGLFKLVPIAKLNEIELSHLRWIKAYEDHKVDLIGDDITKGRVWHAQMVYEYGIMSTYLQDIKDKNMPPHEYTSSTGLLTFHVPFHHEKNKIQGLSVSYIYRSSVSNHGDEWILFAKISNTTKGLTWIYNPVVYCKPRVDEDVVWLSYWPIGNTLDAGDKVHVEIFRETMMIVSGCGASLVYMNSQVEEERCENNSMKEAEVIGGDLSEFEVSTGGYYLCRRDFFYSNTSFEFKWMFGDNVHYTDSRGWRRNHWSNLSWELTDIAKTYLKIIEVGVSFSSESEIEKIEKAISSLVGVKSVSSHKEAGKLTVTGYVDPIEVATCAREIDNMVEILCVKLRIE